MSGGAVKTLWLTFANYRGSLFLLVVLGFVGALLEGVGIGAVIPLLSFLVGTTEIPANSVTDGIQSAFAFLNIDYSFRFLLIFVVGLFLLRAVAVGLFGYIRGRLTADFYYNESTDGIRRLFHTSWPFLLQQKLGAVHSTLVRDIQRTSGLLVTTSQSIQSFTGATIYLVVALTISPLMTLYTVVGGGLLLLVIRPFLSRTQHGGEEASKTEKDISQFITEHVIGMKAIKAAGSGDQALHAGERMLASLRALQTRLALLLSFSTSLFQPFTVLFVVGLFAVMYQTPGFNLISFAATLYLIQRIFTYLESGQSTLHSISESVPYARNLAEFKAKLSANAESRERGRMSFSFEREVAFKNVSFGYSDTRVLEGVTFAIPKGATAALIGPSGAGKTSVADLLLRLFEPTGGQITVDGVSAAELSLQEWRKHFGYVSQDPFLFNGTIEENIRFYRPELTHADIEEAAKQANIYDHIVSLPQQFKTVVGDRGVMLSGGQRQRIALARVLAGKPDVLVLDEATSALDAESEKLIQESIKALSGRVTVFVIAHRLSTVESADTILTLERGTITEQGSPQELLKNPASYFARHYSA